MSKQLYQLAKDGHLQLLLQAIEDDENAILAIYQWLHVAAALGHDEAEEMASDMHEASLDRGGVETVAVLHFEVAQWFIEGTNGVVQNLEHGLAQLAAAQQFQLRESVHVDAELKVLRAKLNPTQRQRFDAIFPGLK